MLIPRNKLTQYSAYILIILSLIFGFFSRVIALLRYTTFDIGSYPDQIRSAYTYINMLQGNWPTLGFPTSATKYFLPPLYYYLVFPSTLFGFDPAIQVFPNGILSLLAIPLFIVLIYQVLENIDSPKRLFLSGLAGFWYSVLWVDIFLNTFEWCPSPIPFFVISFILLFKFQLEGRFSGFIQSILWILYGINLAILVSLHSVTLFVIPLAFFVSIVFFVIKNSKNPYKWWFPVLSIISAIISLTPYWVGENSRKWSNTKEIIATVFKSGNSANQYSIFERLGRVIFNYFELGLQSYFIGISWTSLAITTAFFLLTLFLGIRFFNGNRTIFTSLLFIWVVFLYASSNYQGDYFIHYKLIILFAPILFTISTLAYLNEQLKLVRWLKLSLIIGIIISCASNLYFDIQYLESRFSQNRVTSTADIIEILNKIPENSTICDPKYSGAREKFNIYGYIDTYITKRGVTLSKVCEPGNYLIFPKLRYLFLTNNLWPALTLIKVKPFDKDATIFLENPAASVYVMKQRYVLDQCYSLLGDFSTSCN